MRKGGRIVTLSSAASNRGGFAPEIEKQLLDPQLTMEQLQNLMLEYEV